MRTRSLLLLAGVALAGCAPVLPYHFAETAETLRKKEVGLIIAAGGGGGATDANTGIGTNSCCGGGAVRVRVGLGRGMELGGELSAIGGRSIGPTINGMSYGAVGELNLGGKVRFKLAPVRWFAFIAGVTGSGFVHRDEVSGQLDGGPFVFGADVAGVFSTDPIARILRVYGGARFAFVVPAVSNPASTQTFIVPAGLSIAPTERVRLFVEGGLTGGFSEASFNGQLTRTDFVGGYGLFAFGYSWPAR